MSNLKYNKISNCLGFVHDLITSWSAPGGCQRVVDNILSKVNYQVSGIGRIPRWPYLITLVWLLGVLGGLETRLEARISHLLLNIWIY